MFGILLRVPGLVLSLMVDCNILSMASADKRSVQGFFDVLLILPLECLYLHVRIMDDIFHYSV